MSSAWALASKGFVTPASLPANELRNGIDGKAHPDAMKQTQNRALAPPDKRFFQRLKAAPERLLMLDYDGTVAPFRERRDEAIPYTGVREAIAGLLRAPGTRVVVVSGRALNELIVLLGMEPLPELWASHGWEYRSAFGEDTHYPLPEGAKLGLTEARRRASQESLRGRLEVKPAGVALHWRGLPVAEARAVEKEAWGLWSGLVNDQGLELRPFDGGLELRIPGRDKGTAVMRIMADSPPGTVAAFLGDDLTDEDAFKALPPEGLGVLVRPTLRETAAAAWLKPPEDLLAFFDAWLSVSGGTR